MSGSLTAAIPFIILGLILLVIAVWLIMRMNQSTKVVGDETAKRDVLDEGAARAQRNQALIDAAPAALANPSAQAGAVASTETLAPASDRAEAQANAAAVAEKPALAARTGDDLTMIKGVGPKLVTLLASHGVTSLAQIAAWTDSDIAEIDAKLGRFKGRIERDLWVEQAKLLISDDKEAFFRKFGKNGQ